MKQIQPYPLRMRVQRVVIRLGSLARVVARDPGQVRYLPAWARALRRSTVDSRLPWLPFRVIDRLGEHLGSGSRVFEFGGGGSTLWFADQGADVVTVEHDPDWYPVLARTVGDRPNVEVMHRPSDDDYSGYVSSISTFADQSFDVVVVDGRHRVRCLEAAIPKVAPGGLLLLDDSDRHWYSRAHDLLEAWPSVTYSGLTPSKSIAGTTTVWSRPAR